MDCIMSSHLWACKARTAASGKLWQFSWCNVLHRVPSMKISAISWCMQCFCPNGSEIFQLKNANDVPNKSPANLLRAKEDITAEIGDLNCCAFMSLAGLTNTFASLLSAVGAWTSGCLQPISCFPETDRNIRPWTSAWWLGRPRRSTAFGHHRNSAITESLGKSEIHGPKHFCDLCRNVPCHENSDHLMSFNRRILDTFHVCGLCQGCTGTEIISGSPFFDFLTFWFFDSEAGARRRPKRRKPGPPTNDPGMPTRKATPKLHWPLFARHFLRKVLLFCFPVWRSPRPGPLSVNLRFFWFVLMFSVVVTSPTMPSSNCRRDHWQPKCSHSKSVCPMCRNSSATQPNASPGLCNCVQAKTIPEGGWFINGINTVSFHNCQLKSFAGREQTITEKSTVRSVLILDWNFESRWLWNLCFRPPAGARNFSDLPNLKHVSHSNSSKCSFEIFRQHSDFWGRIYGA